MSQGYASHNITENAIRVFEDTWVRPADWLTLPSVSSGENKVVGLHAVFPGSGNFCAFMIDGAAYTVDWGYGSPENFNSGVIAYHRFNYDDYPGTECSRGYRQAIVTITPQSGQTFTGNINFHQLHNQSNLSTPITQGWLDVTVSAQSALAILFGKPTTTYYSWPYLLEQFTMVGPHASMTSANSMFRNALRLRQVNIPETFGASVTNCSYMFENCRSLRVAPSFNTAMVTLFSNMFMNCFNLRSIPQYDTGIGTDFSNAFYNCYQLQSVPLLNMQSATTTSSMFYGCISLTEVPNFNLKSLITGTAMFRGCNQLASIPDFNTSGATTLWEMFYDCNALNSAPNLDLRSAQSIYSMFYSCDNISYMPNFNFTGTVTNATGFCSNVRKITSVPDWNLSGATRLDSMFSGCDALEIAPNLNSKMATNMTSMFFNCYSLKEIPSGFISTGVTNFTTMFSGCNSLVEIPLINTSKSTTFTSMFNGCSSLRKVPLLDVSSGTVFTSMFAGCVNLATGAISGTKYSISYAGCNLSGVELDNIYTNLGTAAGTQTITVTGNYGITDDTITIATAKGWTVAT